MIHSGEANSGHYYSYISDRDRDNERWFEFNDKVIDEFDVDEMDDKAFGGPMTRRARGVRQIKGNKVDNAYMLIYEWPHQIDAKKFAEVVDEADDNQEMQKFFRS